ncbi:MAG TPA: hypothetical protein VGI79_19295 [Caulobacteraceae bacterium]|jgi:hypothetical protein
MSNGSKFAAKAPMALLASAWLLLPAAAWAETPPASDAPVATAQGTPAAPPSTVQTDIKNFIDEDADKDSDPAPDHKPHGFVSVGAGTRGYREVAGAVTLPVGDKANVDVAIDIGQVDGRKH